MNLPIVMRTLGILLLCEAAAMLLPVLVALFYGDNVVLSFLLSVLLAFAAGLVFFSVKVRDNTVGYREGFAIVAFGWLLASVFGALPFFFSGAVSSYVDALFETISGFSTTGATVIPDVEALPNSILFWRAFTHWLGGMGILVLALAIQPALGVGGAFRIMKAESPGPISAKLTPRLRDTAKLLYYIYLVMTVLCVAFLDAGGMPLFDSVVHAFATLGTGGFSVKNASIGAYNNTYYDVVITVFMILAGINFSLYYLAFKQKSPREFLRDEETRIYLAIIAVYTLVIAVNINGTVFSNVLTSLRYAAFQVASVITTTGYATADFNLWPELSRVLLVTLMLIGACAGSTGGGMKVIRVHLIFKYIKREINRLIHPRAVKAIKVNDTVIPETVIANVMGYSLLYILIIILGTVLLLTQKLDAISAMTAVASSLGNIGPGLGLVAPSKTFYPLTDFAKLFLSFCMIVGRLEIYTVLALLFPQFWRK